MRTKLIGICLIVVAIIGIIAALYYARNNRNLPLVFSNSAMVNELWRSYKIEYIESSTFRTLDKQKNNITTSEGESYTMFRSVLMDDKTVFDNSLSWTNTNLKHKNDNLFSWEFGQNSDGKYTIISENGGQNSATDGDTDIALSLIFAYSRWNDTKYLDQAKALVKDIWDKEVVTVNGKLIIAADDLEKTSNSSTIVINPSYFSPYAYKIFAKIDSNDWKKLTSDMYVVLNDSIILPLDKSKGILPPNWITIDRQNGNILASTEVNLNTHFSYDAMRIPWRLAVDWLWNKDKRAIDTLRKLSFLSDQWSQNQKILSDYLHDGTPAVNYESPANYGAYLGYFITTNSPYKNDIYSHKLELLYSPDKGTWKNKLGYYDDNWAWFGIALYQGAIIDLTNGIKFK